MKTVDLIPSIRELVDLAQYELVLDPSRIKGLGVCYHPFDSLSECLGVMSVEEVDRITVTGDRLRHQVVRLIRSFGGERVAILGDPSALLEIVHSWCSVGKSPLDGYFLSFSARSLPIRLYVGSNHGCYPERMELLH